MPQENVKPEEILRTEAPGVFQPLARPARYKAARGGRGSGKSHFFAGTMAEEVGFEGKRAVCIREIQKDLKHSSKQLIEDKIRAFGIQKYFKITDTYIEALKGGGSIIFQGMQYHNAESIKSLEGMDIAWAEEAQTLSQRSLDLLRPTIRKPGSSLWFSWNPRFETDPVEAFFNAKPPPPDSVVVDANYWDNPWFDADTELLPEMEYDRRRDPDKYANIWCGKYQKVSNARVFTNWREEEFETPADARFYFGGDWGFSVDPTVLVRVFIQGRLLFIDQEAYQVGCDIDNTPMLFDKVPGSRRWPIRADSARPETISYMNRHGFNVVGATKGPGSVEDGIEFLKSYDIIVHPRCRHTIDELSFYSWKVDKQTEEVLPVLDDKKNHVIDACRYAVEGLRTKSGVQVSVATLQNMRQHTFVRTRRLS